MEAAMGTTKTDRKGSLKRYMVAAVEIRAETTAFKES
jgi:hypothetical protein